MKSLRIAVALSCAASVSVSVSAAAPPPGLSVESLAVLRAIDLRLATIGYRLATANAALCRDRVPATGAAIHAITQYDRATQPAARRAFGFATPVAIEAVVAGSAAAQAGLRADDGLVAVGGQVLRGDAAAPSVADRDAALAAIAATGSPVRLDVLRDGRQEEVTVAAPPGCAAVFEVVLGPEMTADSDGRVVRIGVRFFERYGDDEVAVVVAHELSHLILRHRIRLAAAGVKSGLLGEIGRNARLSQRAEDEADRLGVTLLYNAGYDPASAARFWQAHGAAIDGGFFRSRTHPATRRRIAAVAAEAATLAARPPRPWLPPVLSARDEPLR